MSGFADYIQPDGGLFCLGLYLEWKPGQKNAVLDGEFSSIDLRQIADHMDKTETTRITP